MCVKLCQIHLTWTYLREHFFLTKWKYIKVTRIISRSYGLKVKVITYWTEFNIALNSLGHKVIFSFYDGDRPHKKKRFISSGNSWRLLSECIRDWYSIIPRYHFTNKRVMVLITLNKLDFENNIFGRKRTSGVNFGV